MRFARIGFSISSAISATVMLLVLLAGLIGLAAPLSLRKHGSVSSLLPPSPSSS